MQMHLLRIPYDAGNRGARMGAGPDRPPPPALRQELDRLPHQRYQDSQGQRLYPVARGARQEIDRGLARPRIEVRGTGKRSRGVAGCYGARC